MELVDTPPLVARSFNSARAKRPAIANSTRNSALFYRCRSYARCRHRSSKRQGIMYSNTVQHKA
ncbi:hypothetical protein [Nostoc sp.]|uniref:hypothetical protein n=1 Tax=Nostoc sp. TaxID=1180 RepID=UPI002FF47744